MKKNNSINKEIILNSKVGKKFVNRLMINGKKQKAEQILLNTISMLHKNAAYSLTKAVASVKPILEVRSIRLRGSNYQVPVPIMEKRRMSLAVKWIVNSAKKRGGKSMSLKLKDEILLAQKNQGDSVKKKITTHKLACSNRAFNHFRWF